MRYALALILVCSMAALAQEAAKPVEVKAVTPPAAWLQKYTVFLTKNAEAVQLQNEVVRLRNELVAEMDGKGYILDAPTVTWVPKPPAEPAK
jgi:hypothetical protein